MAFLVVRDDHIGRLPPILCELARVGRAVLAVLRRPARPRRGRGALRRLVRLDPWLGAAESLELLVDWQAAGALEEPVALARDLAARLGIEWGGGTLVCPPIDDADRVRAVLAEHRIKAAFRGTAIRFSTHVYNDAADIERAAAAIGPLVAQPVGSSRLSMLR